ncbi:hypothetical protein Tco_0765144 [Tanacetum coccineum]
MAPPCCKYYNIPVHRYGVDGILHLFIKGRTLAYLQFSDGVTAYAPTSESVVESSSCHQTILFTSAIKRILIRVRIKPSKRPTPPSEPLKVERLTQLNELFIASLLYDRSPSRTYVPVRGLLALAIIGAAMLLLNPRLLITGHQVGRGALYDLGGVGNEVENDVEMRWIIGG